MPVTEHKFFSLRPQDEEWLGSLSDRLRRLVLGAVTYHSLLQPGRTLDYRIYMGEKWQYPRLTDTSTLNGSLTEGAGLAPMRTLRVTSTVRPKTVFSPHYFAGDELIVDRNVRDILLTPDDATDNDVEQKNPDRGFKHRLYHRLEVAAPSTFDFVLDLIRGHRWRRGLQAIEPAASGDAATVNQSGDSHHPWADIVPGRAGSSAPKAVIVAMHWLQPGGAERWGVETIRLVREAGLLPIVLTDTDSHQPWITRPELEGALVLPLTQPMQYRPGDSPLLRALFEQFSIRGVLIHHCQWMYDRCWWVKKYFPSVPIMDSLHIVEYPYQGGYPAEAVRHDQWIDLHHVISPQVRDWLVRVHHISASKVFIAPLADLTTRTSVSACAPRVEGSSQRLTLAFVGRMARQKRPDAFLLLAHKLHAEHPDDYRFIVQGSGPLDSEAEQLIQRFSLKDVVERRPVDYPVSKTYADSDLLVISSANEGITLTTMEALAAGIPVISTNVGSQYTLIPRRALMPRNSPAFVRAAAHAAEAMRGNEAARRHLWAEEEQRVRKFGSRPSATARFQEILAGWKTEKQTGKKAAQNA